MIVGRVVGGYSDVVMAVRKKEKMNGITGRNNAPWTVAVVAVLDVRVDGQLGPARCSIRLFPHTNMECSRPSICDIDQS